VLAPAAKTPQLGFFLLPLLLLLLPFPRTFLAFLVSRSKKHQVSRMGVSESGGI
jgi:hypothetical protein